MRSPAREDRKRRAPTCSDLKLPTVNGQVCAQVLGSTWSHQLEEAVGSSLGGPKIPPLFHGEKVEHPSTCQKTPIPLTMKMDIVAW